MKPGPLMLDLEGTGLTNAEKELLQHPQVGGVIFFSRNVAGREQVLQLAETIRGIRPDLLLAVDQEGGRVQRFRDGYTRLPPMQVLGDLLLGNPVAGADLLRDCGWLMAVEVIASGLDFSFAPVLDTDRTLCQVVGDRAFSANPKQVTKAAAHFIDGMHEAGMAVTGKHFPGHGGVRADSHRETPVDPRSLAELRNRDLVPFTALLEKLDALMPAHIIFSSIDPDCVGFSSYWLQQVLRGELGFGGVIFSDDLSMKGADTAGGYADKARAALEAGCDMVLVCNSRPGALEVIDWLDRASLPASGRLNTMRARATWDWTTLLASERYRSTITRLENLIADTEKC